jgi:hypothetical protein
VTVISFGDTLIMTGPAPSISVAVTNGRLYLGLDDFVVKALDRVAQDSLAASPRLQAALAAAGAENAGVVYVDVAGLRTLGESLMPPADRAQYETEAQPFVRPITHLILVNRTDGSINVANGFLYVE